MILNVDVVNKIATFQKRGGCIVCGNSDYQIRFTFDSEWSAYPQKTARFIWSGSFHDVTFTGDLCDVPVLYDTTEVEVGVYAGDLNAVADESEIDLKTTTSAFIGCYRSILCEVARPSEDSDRQYASEAKDAAIEAKLSADRAETAADTATERVEEAVKFATDKVEAATNDAANRAEEAAKRAEDAVERTEITVDPTLEIEGMAADAKAAGDRLKILEEWMNAQTYEPMTVKLSVSPTSKEYGDSVTGAKLTFSASEETSSIKLTLPDNTEVDLSKVTSPYTDTNTYLITSDKTWELTAKRADGNKEDKSAEAKISYQYRVYWGVGTEASAFDSDFVTGLLTQGTTLTNSRNRTLSFNSIDNKYVYYAIPTALGTPTFQIGEFPVTGGFETGVAVSVDTGFKDADDKSIELTYNLYRSSNLLKNDEPFKVYIT